MQVTKYIGFNSRLGVSALVSSVLFGLLLVATFMPISLVEQKTEAATGTPQESTLSLNIASNTASVDITVNNESGTFATSDSTSSAAFNVSTNNYTGYTISVTAPDDDGELEVEEESYTLPSIESSMTESTFDTSSNNGKWGWKPSKLNSSTNTNFLPSPTTEAVTLDETSVANSTANNYTIALGARADYTTPAGAYAKTFTLTSVANPVNYVIQYDANSTDSTISGIPDTQSGSVSTTTLSLPSNIPTRDHYSFTGWCSIKPTNTNGVDSCTGTDPTTGATAITFSAGGDYGIDQTTTNTITLYAMWTIDSFTQKTNIRYENIDGTFTSYTTVDEVTKNYGTTYSWSTSQIPDFDSTTYQSASVAEYTVTETKTNEITIYRNTFNCSKQYRLENADGTFTSYTTESGSPETIRYGATCSYNKTVTDYKNSAAGTNDSEASTSATITEDIILSLTLYRNTYTLTVNRNTTNIGSASATTPAVHGSNYYRWGQVVGIAASPNTGSRFTSWTQSGTTGTIDSATSATTTFTMGKGNSTVTAGGEYQTYNIALTNTDATTAGSTSTTATYNSNTLASITKPSRVFTISGLSNNGVGGANATVTFNTDSGSVCTSTTNCKYTYTFNGWYTATSGGTKIIDNAGLLTASNGWTDTNRNWTATENKTVYAQWGTGTAITLPTITKTGYSCGWATSNSSTTRTYSSGQSGVTLTGNTTLYGTCTANQYTIALTNTNATTSGSTSVKATYDSNALSANITKPSRVYNITGFTLPSGNNATSAAVTYPTATGTNCSSATACSYTYGFKGWYTAASGGTQIIDNSTNGALTASNGWTDANRNWTTTSDKTVYAQWSNGTLTLPTITKTGHTCGWTTTSTGATSIAYESGYAGLVPVSNMTLYGVCTVNGYTQSTRIRYENSDGTWGDYTTVDTATVNYGNTYSWSTAQISGFDSTTYQAASVASYTVTGDKTNDISIYRNTFTCTKQYRLMDTTGNYPSTYTDDGIITGVRYGSSCSYTTNQSTTIYTNQTVSKSNVTANQTLQASVPRKSFTITKEYRLMNADGTYPSSYTGDGTQTVYYGGSYTYTRAATTTHQAKSGSVSDVTENKTISLDVPRKTFTCKISSKLQNADGSYATAAVQVNTTLNYGQTCSWSRAADTTYKAASYSNTITSNIDTTVPVDRNTFTVTKRYRKQGTDGVYPSSYTSDGTATVRYGASYTYSRAAETGFQAASTSATITAATTLSLDVPRVTFTCTKQYQLETAAGGWSSYTSDGSVTAYYGGSCSYSKTVTDYKGSASGTNGSAGSASASSVTENKTLSISMYRNTYALTVNRNTSYISSVTGAGTYRWGQAVSISATASSGNEFTSWSQTSGTTGTFGSTTSASTTFTMGKGAATIYADGKISAIPMQSMTLSQCTTAGVNVQDTRDGETYLVKKLADGKCWMLDNLALDLVAKISTLTNANTNASTTTLNYLKNGGGSTSDQYATAAVSNWTSGLSYSTPLVNMASKDVIPSGAPAGGSGSNKVGGYYNYCAASAGSYCYGNGNSAGTSSGNATEDICPKGWRMPTGGSSGEYKTLYDKYRGASEGQATAFKNALSTPLSGFFINSSAVFQGSNGYFWSSTRYDSNSMYYLSVASSSVDPLNYSTRNGGNPLRCVMKDYLQDQTAATLAADLPNVGDTKTYYDKRDEEPYLVGHLADGKYWLLDNLRFDIVAHTNEISSANTNIQSSTESAALTSLKSGNRNAGKQYATAGVSYQTSGNSFSVPLIAIKNASDTSWNPDTEASVKYGDGSGKIGVYYNYCAASAGTYCYGNGNSAGTSSGNTGSDICPKGWRMPTGGSSGEYNTLYGKYSGASEGQATAFKNALSTPLSGLFNYGSALNQGGYGNFWSSTRSDNSYMYNLYVNSSYVNSTGGGYRDYGFSLRCLLK